MATPVQWHPGTAPLAPLWSVALPLLPDELLSSWLIRSALAQGCDPSVLTGAVWPRWRVWGLDVDRGVGAERLSALSRCAGLPASAFEAACLRRVVAPLNTGPLAEVGTWGWMLTLGARQGRRQGGLQMCPDCWVTQAIPYYQMSWRLAWQTCCRTHGVRLRDRCPHCDAPLEPHRLEAISGTLTLCARCLGDLRIGERSLWSEPAATVQQVADGVALTGQGTFWGVTLEAREWFAVVRRLLNLLRRAAKYPDSAVTAMFAALEVPIARLSSPATGLPLELLPVQEREALFTALWPLLQADQNQWLQAASQAGVTRSAFLSRDETLPLIWESLLQALPEHRRVRPSKSDSRPPKSQRAVTRLYALLRRKV
ncbi:MULTISPECIES: TniQ family protein [unclassified Deinococcus]|uniref:TniQ family protein n=1 Tax=unclassified Deinococcus TaxID=2623546 RepID=UPI001E3517B4|nr:MULTISPECIES: TniQ family protein [unclassified Deinococcus]